MGLFEDLRWMGEDGTEVVGPFVGLFEGLDVDGLKDGTEVVGTFVGFWKGLKSDLKIGRCRWT